MSEASHRNATVIGALLAELEALGVREFCVAAGARNAPLLAALVARSSDEREPIRLHHFFEERSAAFFALGRVMDARKPVAVVTTSGTAVAELFPAVMEAHYQALPLVVVTADRPSRYRGSGAPQAVEQPGIFGGYVVRQMELECADGLGFTMSDDVRSEAGPMHFNVCLEEGMEPGIAMRTPAPTPLPFQSAVHTHHGQEWREFWAADGSLVVLASGIHPEDVPLAREFLLKLAAPIVAEATSNLLDDESLRPLLLPSSEQTLKRCDARRVLRLGAVPSWRWWRELDDREDVPVLNVSRADFRGMARSHQVAHVPWEMLGDESLEIPQASSLPGDTLQDSARLVTLLDSHPHAEPSWMRHLSRMVGGGATVLLGNSLAIREWNLAAQPPQAGTRFFANRGANGIDGLVSTWLGVSAGAPESWLILGDLSALYDLSAPWILTQLRKARRRIVVINNGGGQIFSRVAWLKEADAMTRRVMENPHTLSFEPWARLWNLSYHLITDVAGCRDEGAEGCSVWEVRPDAAETTAFWQEWQR